MDLYANRYINVTGNRIAGHLSAHHLVRCMTHGGSQLSRCRYWIEYRGNFHAALQGASRLLDREVERGQPVVRARRIPRRPGIAANVDHGASILGHEPSGLAELASDTAQVGRIFRGAELDPVFESGDAAASLQARDLLELCEHRWIGEASEGVVVESGQESGIEASFAEGGGESLELCVVDAAILRSPW
jgi:hypothetical protein